MRRMMLVVAVVALMMVMLSGSAMALTPQAANGLSVAATHVPDGGDGGDGVQCGEWGETDCPDDPIATE